eukprot:scaffold80909_cov19-Tisochrysis_lutea.AAC.2
MRHTVGNQRVPVTLQRVSRAWRMKPAGQGSWAWKTGRQGGAVRSKCLAVRREHPNSRPFCAQVHERTCRSLPTCCCRAFTWPSAVLCCVAHARLASLIRHQREQIASFIGRVADKKGGSEESQTQIGQLTGGDVCERAILLHELRYRKRPLIAQSSLLTGGARLNVHCSRNGIIEKGTHLVKKATQQEWWLRQALQAARSPGT